MITLQDMQATRKAVLDLSVYTRCEEHIAERGFVYFNHFYIIASVAPLDGKQLNEADVFAPMFYCDVYNEGIASRDLRDCEEFLFQRMHTEMEDLNAYQL